MILRKLWNCLRGRHQWVGLQSPNKTMYICEVCFKKSWKKPQGEG